MKTASTKARKLRRSIVWLLGLVVVCRLAIPISPAGYWRGPFFDCLCSADMVDEFHDGGVKYHLLPRNDSGANLDGVETHPAGTYESSGWSSFGWNQSDAKGSQRLALKPGWLFCRIVDPQSGQVWWAIREFSWGRLRRLQAR